MKYRQIAVLEALRSAQRFLDANAALLTGVELAAARMRLDEVIVKLSEYALNQVASDRHARQETARQCELSHKLRVELLQPIAVIARHCLREVPQFKALQLPKARVPRSEFIARARRMLAAAAIHKGTFQAYGLPSSFLDDIEVALAKLESSAKVVGRFHRGSHIAFAVSCTSFPSSTIFSAESKTKGNAANSLVADPIVRATEPRRAKAPSTART